MDITKMKELNDRLKQAAEAYYSGKRIIMSDAEYDELYDKLLAAEKETGIILADSVTQNVGYEVVSSLPKMKHPSKMLSLDKTKDRNSLVEWLNGRTGFLSWKLDGLTVVLTYREGSLVQAVTRGNGEIGEIITFNAKHFLGIPLTIPDKQEIIVRGEALISYPDFERINRLLEPVQQYRNPRNLCSGTVRQYNSKVVSERCVRFYAFNLVSGIDENSFSARLNWLSERGFQTVYGELVTPADVVQKIGEFESRVQTNDFPSDGLVLMLDDVAYGNSLGVTSKFPRNGIAFKWADDTAYTTLLNVEWSASRTGLINPVAVFNPVELEGTIVERASVHNVSIVEELQLGIGDTISVYKANMIIPQIRENTTRSGSLSIPSVCPCCNGKAEINVSKDNVKTLMCVNPDCPAKHVGKYELFVDREAMNIVGVATSTIDEFVGRGYLKTFSDFYHLDRYKDEIVSIDGFGEKSYSKMVEAVEKSRKTELSRVLYALGIPNIGRTASRIICQKYPDPLKLPVLTADELMGLDGIGDILAASYAGYWQEPANQKQYFELLEELDIQISEVNTESGIAGKTFVITGSVNLWKNRNELKAFIESNGGKVASAVSAKTDFLINNDVSSNSSKNKTAKALGIPIISEEDFKSML